MKIATFITLSSFIIPAQALNNFEYKSLLDAAGSGNVAALKTIKAFQGDFESLSIMKDLAKTGNVDAQLMLGTIYSNDENRFKPGVSKDIDEAIIWYSLAAKQNNNRAQFQLAEIYAQRGRHAKDGVEDQIKAFHQYRNSAENGNVLAQYEMGMRYFKGDTVDQDFVQAKAWFTKAAARGEVKSMAYLAYMFNYGKGVPKDNLQAEEWYGKIVSEGHAPDVEGGQIVYLYHFSKMQIYNYILYLKTNLSPALKGDSSAQFNVGEMFSNEPAFPRDYIESIKWYRLAVAQGNPSAMYNLGSLYFAGNGVEKDDVLAYSLSGLAFSFGIKQGRGIKEMISKRLSKQQLEEGDEIIKNWHPGVPFPLTSKSGAAN